MPDNSATWVVGVDGSDNSITALRWAIARAATSTHAGRAISVRVVAAWNVSILEAVDVTEMVAAVRRRATTIVESIDHHGVPIDVAVTRRPAAEALLDASDEAEIVVVGSRGRSGLAELVLGSVSRQLATHARTPVAIVPEHAPLGEIRKVVLGYDGSDNAEAALGWVCDRIDRIADRPQIEVITALELAAFGDADLVRNRYPEIVAEARSEFERALRQYDIEGRLTGHFVTGNVRKALASAAQDAQLVVVGARGQGSIGAALLGSVSTWMLHHTPCALVVVPG